MPRGPARLIAPCAAGVLAVGAVHAQTAPAPAPAASAAQQVLPTVQITGRGETATSPVPGYRATQAQTATKTDTPLRETPQSVTVITRDQIVEQGATSVQEALGYAAGVRGDAYGLDSRTDSVRIRGGYPAEYLDGLRKNFEYYTSNARTEPYTLERIEVLRGPASMLFGQGSTGGILNMVTKRPLATRGGEVGLQVGSFGRKQGQLDLTGPVDDDGRWLYRLVGVVRESDTQVDFVPDDRRVLAPSLTWRPSTATSLTLQGLYQKDKTGSSSQFFPWAGVLTPNPNGRLPTNRFIGDPSDRYDTERTSLGSLFEHRFDSGWTVRQNVRWTTTSNAYHSLYGDSFVLPGGWAGDPVNQSRFGRFASDSDTKTRLLTVDQNVQGRLATGPVEHTLLVGLDVARYDKTSRSGFDDPTYLGGTVPLVDAYAPVYPAFTRPVLADDPGYEQRQVGVYAQDQLRLENWLLTLGLRHDKARQQSDGADADRSSATTKRAGLLYAFPSGLSPYVSYSESFTPVAAVQAQSFRPLRGKQWEAGLKWEPPQGRLSANVAVYDLREQNQLVQDPVSNTFSQLGETRAKGVEVEVRGRVTSAFDLIANYTYTDLDPSLEQVPRHQAQVWGRYAFALGGVSGFTVGAGVRHLSAFSDAPAPRTPSVSLLDLLFAWDNGPWRLALNVNNATDEIYVSTCLGRGDCWYGARRNVVGTVAYRF